MTGLGQTTGKVVMSTTEGTANCITAIDAAWFVGGLAGLLILDGWLKVLGLAALYVGVSGFANSSEVTYNYSDGTSSTSCAGTCGGKGLFASGMLAFPCSGD